MCIRPILFCALVALAGCGSEETDEPGRPDVNAEDAGADVTPGSDADEPDVDAADADISEPGSCDPIESAPGRVQIGFWATDDCSGDPIALNSFPVESDAPCYCWPGGSGQNSADSFSCNGGDGSFTYTQFNSLTCGAGDDTPTVKTSRVGECEQDIPPTLYSMILDYSACE